MAECKLQNGRVLRAEEQPYIVAEANTSHNGNLNMAYTMIEKAKEAGCDCIKFQSWSAESLYSRSYYKENPIAERMVKKFAFSKEQQLELAVYCRQQGISFASTPYSKEEVDFLIEQCEVPYIKIASMDINNLPFLNYIANTKMPIVLATGMADMEEIQRAVDSILSTGNENLCLLHCVSNYPAKPSEIRLKNILGLKEIFINCPIGFSDHSIGISMACAAVSLGAVLIEKHFTLDNSKIGMDNQMATEPKEMRELVRECHNVYIALGTKERQLQEAELKQRSKMRRSIVSAREMKKGEIIREEDLTAKRPGTGISPEQMNQLIGKRLLNDLEKDMVISWQNLI